MRSTLNYCLMAPPTTVDVGGIVRPPGTADLSRALQPYQGRLGERAAAHLLRRAGFGGTPDEVRRYGGMTAQEAVAALIVMPPANATAPPPELLAAARPAPPAVTVALQLWWLNRMLETPAPLQEKMALYFHGHFTSRATPRFPWITYNQNALFRRYALGSLRELTRDVSKDAAMLVYLDGAQNVASHPNENYARELMELFTLGVDNYTEEDVRESARAWTGWHVYRADATVSFDPANHDYGKKRFLGQTGNFTGDDIVDIIFAQPQCAKFFASSLLNWFVYNDPETELTDAVAALLHKHDFELAPVVATILRSNVFYSARAYRALVKSPVEFVVGSYKSLALSKVDDLALPALNQMGQRLFFPPSVAGWPGGANWLTSGTMVARQNFLVRLLTSQNVGASRWLQGLPMSPARAAGDIAQTILQSDAATAAVAEFDRYLRGADNAAPSPLTAENFDLRVRGAAYLAMATPGYQLN